MKRSRARKEGERKTAGYSRRPSGRKIWCLTLRTASGRKVLGGARVPSDASLKLSSRVEYSVVDDTTADLQNFGKMLLVFGRIGTDICN